jgi:hypothetical protein
MALKRMTKIFLPKVIIYYYIDFNSFVNLSFNPQVSSRAEKKERKR